MGCAERLRGESVFECVQCDLFDGCSLPVEKIKKMRKRKRRSVDVDSRLYGIGLSRLGIAGGVVGVSDKMENLIALDVRIV